MKRQAYIGDYGIQQNEVGELDKAVKALAEGRFGKRKRNPWTRRKAGGKQV